MLNEQAQKPVELPGGSSKTAEPLELDDGDLIVRREILPGGVRLITQQVPGTRATTVGLWVGTGSRDESPGQAGASHFLEHLLFKGTMRRTAKEIAETFDSVGGESNAATSKEATYYWAKTLDTDSTQALSTLTDMVTSSLLTEKDVETERSVIVDELAMSEDSPAEVAHEAFARALFGDSPLGRPVGGTTASVEELTADGIRELYGKHYRADNLMVSVAGSLDHDRVVEDLSSALDMSTWSLNPDSPTKNRSLIGAAASNPPMEVVVGREVEQAHILVGGDWLDVRDNRRPASNLLFTILGGGMSSRLFQEIRERRGLAYTTYAFESAYLDAGYFGMYAGCAPANVEEVEKIMWGEVQRLASGDLPEEELDRAKGQLRGGLALGLEDSAARMMRLGRAEVTGRFVSVDAALGRLGAVTVQQVCGLAETMLAQPKARAVVTSR